MGQMVEIQLGEYRSVGAYDANGVACGRGDIVIIDVQKGFEFGKVLTEAGKTCAGRIEAAAGRLLRKASDGDLRQIVNNQIKAKDALESCRRKVAEAKIDMQLIKAEYSFDSTKILFFFAAEDRVDFRNLVKDLAKMFRVRIELKQIGVRDKAKIIGGYGVCGRELCCSSYMKDFHPLSIKMAKEQGLPLNPSKISGVCGRVKCCMAYEYNVYREFAKSMPRMGQKITTPEGAKGRVVAVDILKRFITVDLDEGKTTKIVYAQPSTN